MFSGGKAPGNDGLTTDFYKGFWNLLGHQPTDALNYSYAHGELSNSQKQATIRLIDKKDRDRRYIKNWQPISLLNVDVKIASKALTILLLKVLPEIIQVDQYASLSKAERYLMRFAQLTISWNTPKLNKYLVAFDFEKALDSLSWTFLFKALNSFNFGKSVISWVSALYSNISSCILNNGFSTQMFDACRGVRQGDPLSAYLFIISLELLLITVTIRT